MPKTYYRQCKLVKLGEEYPPPKMPKLGKWLEPKYGWRATWEKVGWIPEKFAKEGGVIKLKNGDGTWSDGWIVDEVWGRLSEENLPDFHREIKWHLKNTGDIN